MKRIIKSVALLAVSVILTLTLCSCDLIDEKREQHAKWIKKDESFEFCGETYHRVPGTITVNIFSNGYGYLTDANVPVLLSDNRGSRFQYNKENGVAICGKNIYATSTNFDYVKNNMKLRDYSLPCYCASQTAYDEKTKRSRYELFVVSEELRDAISKLCSDIEKNPNSYSKVTNVVNSMHYFTLFKCDEKGVFKSNSEAATVCRSGSLLYIRVKNSSDLYLVDKNTEKLLLEFVESMKAEGVKFYEY